MSARGRRRLVAGLVLVAALLTAWAIVSSIRARGDLYAARDRLGELRNDDQRTLEAARAALADARVEIRSARGRVREIGPSIVGRLPILGRNVKAVRAAADAALVAVDSTTKVVDVVATDAPFFAADRVDLARLSELEAVLRDGAAGMTAPLGRLQQLRTSWTGPTVSGSVRAARDDYASARDGFLTAADLLSALRAVLGGDGERRLLFVLQNNAELRGSGGLVSVFAEATTRDGRIAIGGFRDVQDIADPPEKVRRVPAPADYVARYGTFLANTTLWKNANMTPDVPTASAVIAALSQVSLGRGPTAIITLDVPAIAAVLDATGPAKLSDGRTIDGENAVRELLVRAYRGVPDTLAGQIERRRRLRAAADGVIDRLLHGDAETVPLLGALSRAATGRHLALWSAVPAEQRAIVAAGAGGAVRADSTDLAMVTIQNLGGGGREGNKLDYYADRAHDIRVHVTRDVAETTHTFRLHNKAPATGLPNYVAGVEKPGETRNLVAFAIPAAAELISVERDGAATGIRVEPEDGYQAVVATAVLPPGSETTWTLRYRVPIRDGHYSLRLVPQPVARDAELTLKIDSPRGTYLSRVQGGELDFNERWAREHLIEMDVSRGSWWRRTRDGLRRFWDEPVNVG